MSDSNTLNTVANRLQLPHSFLKPTLKVPLVATLLQKQYSQADIAKYFSISRQAVSQFVDRHLEELQPFMDYDNIMSAAYKNVAYQALSKVDDKDYKKASLQSKVTTAAIATEKHRLLDDKSTENINTQSVVYDVENMIRQCKDALQVGESETEEPDNTPDNNTSHPPTKPNIDSDE